MHWRRRTRASALRNPIGRLIQGSEERYGTIRSWVRHSVQSRATALAALPWVAAERYRSLRLRLRHSLRLARGRLGNLPLAAETYLRAGWRRSLRATAAGFVVIAFPISVAAALLALRAADTANFAPAALAPSTVARDAVPATGKRGRSTRATAFARARSTPRTHARSFARARAPLRLAATRAAGRANAGHAASVSYDSRGDDRAPEASATTAPADHGRRRAVTRDRDSSERDTAPARGASPAIAPARVTHPSRHVPRGAAPKGQEPGQRGAAPKAQTPAGPHPPKRETPPQPAVRPTPPAPSQQPRGPTHPTGSNERERAAKGDRDDEANDTTNGKDDRKGKDKDDDRKEDEPKDEDGDD